MTHLTDETIHDLLDGELDDVRARAARSHLDACGACADRAARLSELLSGMGGLPGEAMPGRDLWPGIEARIRGETPVIPLPLDDRGEEGDAARSSGSAGAGPPRRISVSLPQAWAAGIAVALLSGGAVWFALAGGGSPAAGPVAGGVTAAAVGAPDGPAMRVRSASDAYDEAVHELEAIVEAGRHLLDPETLRTLEESRTAIEAAIDEAEAALAADPGSQLLHRLLLQHQQTRLRILQQTASGLPRA